MMNKLCAAVSVFATVIASPLFAAPLIDIDTAVQMTLKDNNTLRSVRMETEKAKAFKMKADAVWLPSVNVAGSVSTQREPLTSDGSDKSDSRSISASLSQPVYTGGKNTAIRAQAKEQKTIAEALIEESENSAVGELYGRFYYVLLKKKQIEAEEAAVKTSSLHLKQVEKMAELGLANRLEVIRAGRQLTSNEAELANAHGLYESALISLMNYMALPPSEKRETAGVLYTPKVHGSRSESLENALIHRADIRKLEAQLALQDNQIKIERSALLPQISAGLSTGWSNPYNRLDKAGTSWKAELSLSLPVFDRNTAKSAVKAAKAVHEQDKIAIQQKELDIKSDIETAWTDIETTLKSLNAQEKSLALAKESLRLAEIGYSEGVTPQLDLLEAQQALTTAQVDYNAAQYAHLMAVVALKVTEGTIIQWNGDK